MVTVALVGMLNIISEQQKAISELLEERKRASSGE